MKINTSLGYQAAEYPRCLECLSSGWVIDKRGEHKRCPSCGAERAEARRLNRAMLPGGSWIGATFMDTDWGRPGAARHRMALTRWALGEVQPHLLIHGPNQVGKTHALVACARRIIESGRSAHWVRMPRLLAEAPGQMMATCIRVVKEAYDVLFLDDVGAGDHGGKFQALAYATLIGDQIEQGGAVAISTNRDPTSSDPGAHGSLIGCIGPRQQSRLVNRGTVRLDCTS